MRPDRPEVELVIADGSRVVAERVERVDHGRAFVQVRHQRALEHVAAVDGEDPPGRVRALFGEVVAEPRRLLDVPVLVGRGQDHNGARDERKHRDGHDETQRILLSVRTAVLFLLAAGCGFHAVGNGDGGDLDMGTSSMDDLEGADLFGVPPGSDLSMTSGGGCPDPLLLVGVENLHNGDTGGGRVARFSLTASGVKQCTTLSGQGLIAPQPLAVAGMLGGIGAATIDGLYFVDPATDTVKWSKPAPQVSGWLPQDAFSI